MWIKRFTKYREYSEYTYIDYVQGGKKSLSVAIIDEFYTFEFDGNTCISLYYIDIFSLTRKCSRIHL